MQVNMVAAEAVFDPANEGNLPCSQSSAGAKEKRLSIQHPVHSVG